VSIWITSSQMKHELYVFRIRKVVNDLMTKEDVFREKLHQTRIIMQITDLMEILSPEEFLAIEEQELRQQVGKFMASQLVYGLLDSENIRATLKGRENIR
jgi:hypothetical protein